MSSTLPKAVGFPPPLLGEQPLRLDVLGAVPGQWLALDKPPGVLPEAHRWFPDAPDLICALNAQVAAGKPELAPLEIDKAGSVYKFEPEATGVLLLALGDEAFKGLRDAYGSGQFTFTFQFLAKDDGGSDERVCELPLAVHRTQSRGLVSHTSGKKCTTRFRRLERLGGYGWWEAETTYVRTHQIRLHAAEVGLPVVGDRRYRGPRGIMLSDIKPGYRSRGEETPLYGELCLHLGRVVVAAPDWSLEASSPLPKGLGVLQTRLRRHLVEKNH